MRIFGYEIKKKSANTYIYNGSIGSFSFDFGDNKRLSKQQQKDLYNTLCYFSMCVDRIANAAASIKYEYKTKSGKELPYSRLKFYLQNPSKYDTLKELTKKTIVSLLVLGEGILFYDNEDNLTFAPMECVEFYIDKMGRPVRVVIQIGDVRFDRLFTEIMQLRETDIVNQWRGRGKGEGSGNLLLSAVECFNVESFTFKNRGATTFLADETQGYAKLPSENEKQEKELNTRMAGSEKAGKVLILQGKYSPVKIFENLKDMMLDKAKESYKRDICDLFGLDVAIFNDTSSKTYNTKPESILNAYTDVFIPYAEYFMSELKDFVCEKYKITNEYVTLCVDDIPCIAKSLATDRDNRHKQVIEEVKAGILTAEEAKKELYDKDSEY